MVQRCVLVVLCLALLVSCSPGGPGTPCQATPDGARACNSRVCIQVQCASGDIVQACAGSLCNISCPQSSDQCVQVPNLNASYCMPRSVCP